MAVCTYYSVLESRVGAPQTQLRFSWTHTMDSKVVSGLFQTVPLSASELDFSGEPYSVSVLKVGYCLPQSDGTFRADGTITLIRGPKTILVDTGGPWDRDFLLKTLKERGVEPGDINLVVGTHGHSDHIGNLGLFTEAQIIVGYDISEGDTYRPSMLAHGHVYCVDQHVSDGRSRHWAQLSSKWSKTLVLKKEKVLSVSKSIQRVLKISVY